MEFAIPVIELLGIPAMGNCTLWTMMTGTAGNGTYQMRKNGAR